MKLFVTGGAGFIGSNFILKQVLIEKNVVLNFDKLTYAGNLNNLKNIINNRNYKFVQGDIGDRLKVQTALNEFKPDVLVNFAAESHVDRSIDGPFEFIQTNIVGTSILLAECFEYYNSMIKDSNRNFTFIHISTDEVFGSLGQRGYFTEETAYDPSSPYSASKASSDHLVRSWYRTYGLPVLITNCSNNYGPYQFPEKLIPLMILNCIYEKNLPIYGDGKNIRDWLYVEDHCDAIYKVIIDGEIGETYNIGGNNEIKNIDIVLKICQHMDKLLPRSNNRKYKELITYVKDRPGHDFRYAINTSKIRSELNWVPSENFNSGIVKTVKWYLKNKHWWLSMGNSNYNQERLGVIDR